MPDDVALGMPKAKSKEHHNPKHDSWHGMCLNGTHRENARSTRCYTQRHLCRFCTVDAYSMTDGGLAVPRRISATAFSNFCVFCAQEGIESNNGTLTPGHLHSKKCCKVQLYPVVCRIQLYVGEIFLTPSRISLVVQKREEHWALYEKAKRPCTTCVTTHGCSDNRDSTYCLVTMNTVYPFMNTVFRNTEYMNAGSEKSVSNFRQSLLLQRYHSSSSAALPLHILRGESLHAKE